MIAIYYQENLLPTLMKRGVTLSALPNLTSSILSMLGNPSAETPYPSAKVLNILLPRVSLISCLFANSSSKVNSCQQCNHDKYLMARNNPGSSRSNTCLQKHPRHHNQQLD